MESERTTDEAPAEGPHLPPVSVIHATSVFTKPQLRRALGLAKTTLDAEISAGRLKVSRRAGRYCLLGQWVLDWLGPGELHPGRRRKRRGQAVEAGPTPLEQAKRAVERLGPARRASSGGGAVHVVGRRRTVARPLCTPFWGRRRAWNGMAGRRGGVGRPRAAFRDRVGRRREVPLAPIAREEQP
jgi:hypothetical protein